MLGGDHPGPLCDAQPRGGHHPNSRGQRLQGVGQTQPEIIVQVGGQHDLAPGFRTHPVEHPSAAERQLGAHRIRQDDKPRPGARHGLRVVRHQGVVGTGSVRQTHVHRDPLVQIAGPFHEVDPAHERLRGGAVDHHLRHRLRSRHHHHHPRMTTAPHGRHRLLQIPVRAAADRRDAHRPFGLHRDPADGFELLPAHGGKAGGEHHVPGAVRAEDPARLASELHPEAGRHQRLRLRAVPGRLLPQHHSPRGSRLPHHIHEHHAPMRPHTGPEADRPDVRRTPSTSERSVTAMCTLEQLRLL